MSVPLQIADGQDAKAYMNTHKNTPFCKDCGVELQEKEYVFCEECFLNMYDETQDLEVNGCTNYEQDVQERAESYAQEGWL